MALSNLPDRFDAAPRKMRDLPGETDLKKLEVHRAFGKEIARAFDLLGLQRKQVAATLSVDEAQVSRWCAGTEHPPMARLNYDLPGFRGAYIAASAEAATGADLQHEHTITWRRRA
jgi:DNA-binding transcriptional regulator YiaG